MKEQLIIFFDGYCGLCNGFVNFLLKIDRKDRLRFATLQSEQGKLIPEKAVPKETDSVIVKDGEQILIKSEAVFYIFKRLGGGWNLFRVLSVLPLSWLNRIYDFIAERRYRVFGKRDACRMPTPEERKKFL